MRCSKDIYEDGFMMLELALLMPGILSILIMIIFTGYYYHDRCIIQRSAYSSCLKSVDLINEYGIDTFSEYDIEDTMMDLFEKELDNRLAGNWVLNTKIRNTDEEVTIQVSGNMKCIEGIFSQYISKAVYGVEFSESVMKFRDEYLYK